MTEVPIISNRLGEMYESAGLKAINGRIDLMVVDESGRVHIYDFKVSRKEVGEYG